MRKAKAYTNTIISPSHTNYVCPLMIFCVVTIYFIHIITIQNSGLSLAVGLVEFIVGLIILCWKIPYFYIYLIIILGGTFDVPAFVTGEVGSVAYNFILFPLVLSYHFYFLIIILYVINRRKIYVKGILDSAPDNIRGLVNTIDVMVFCGLFFGAITLLTNDNNILNILWIRYLVGDIVSLCIIPMLGVCLITNLLIHGAIFSISLQRALISIMISIPIVTFLSLLLGLHGRYGDETILLAPLSLFFSPLIILFAFYKKYSMRGWAVCIFGLCMIFQLFFSNALSGKSWLALGFIVVMIICILYKKQRKSLAYTLIIASIACSGLVVSLIEKKIEDSTGVSSGKLAQAFLLLSVSNEDWYENVPYSPKVRIEEFLNIGEEYVKKPWFAIFGKGWCGNVPDHRNGLGNNDESSYSLDQYSNNTFINMHETINVVFLKYGIIGLIFIIVFIKRLFVSISFSPWGACAILWLVLFLGYSLCLGSFGMTSLILALYVSDCPNNYA